MVALLKTLPENQKQIVKFTIIGGFAVLTDLAIYSSLLMLIDPFDWGWADLEAVAKTFGFLGGSLVTYNLNKFWTWRRKDRSNRRLALFLALYGSSLLLNVKANDFALHMLQTNDSLVSVQHDYALAFIFATGCSAVYNFIGQKFWIFKHQGQA